MKLFDIKYFVMVIFFFVAAKAQVANSNSASLSPGGEIPFWQVSGPYEQPLTGFGIPADTASIDEKNISLAGIKDYKNWNPESVNENNFLDFNNSLGWEIPKDKVSKIWHAKAAYAYTEIFAEKEMSVQLLLGSCTSVKVLLNGNVVHQISNDRNAVADQDTINLSLEKGINRLLVKVGNSHRNYNVAYFAPIKYEWGFFSRIITNDSSLQESLKVIVPARAQLYSTELISTFFFKMINGKLNQRFDLVINSNSLNNEIAAIEFDFKGENYSINIGPVNYGQNRHQIFLPEITADQKLKSSIRIGEKSLEETFELKQRKQYKIHMMLTTHMDIGYTHPQPVVKEKHCTALDNVISICEKDELFKWTIEATWIIEQYRESRSKEQFEKLISLIKENRISVSPLYTNPFTGWVSYEEMIRSLDLAKELSAEFGIKYNSVLYNDVPGEAWFTPQLLEGFGIKLIANGINEIYGDYKLQKSLPKAFLWEGSAGKKIVNYLTEAYDEGRSYGLIRGIYVTEHRLWERLNKLENRGYEFDLILMNTAFTDNGGIAFDQYKNALKWNEEYEYPKFIVSNLNEFTDEFVKQSNEKLKTLRGDWTSAWDILYQGEPERIKKQRWAQHNLFSAEKLNSISSLLYNQNVLLKNISRNAFDNLLHFSGHGSGLEYGYGSKQENDLTVEYREGYVQNAYLLTQELLHRSVTAMVTPHESFEGPGIYVFNTLSWERNSPVEVEFAPGRIQDYKVIDMSTNKTEPSVVEGDKLFFIAEQLPSMGYKKYRLAANKNPLKIDADVIAGEDNIENKFYKIQFDKNSGEVQQIIDKKNKRNFVDEASTLKFNEPVVERYQLGESFAPLYVKNFEVEVIDKSPVCVSLVIKRPDELFEKTTYTLWNNIDKIEITHRLNLNKIAKTDYTEEYGFALPFNLTNPEIRVEVLGGLLNPATDKLPGNQNEAHSIRRNTILTEENYSANVCARDSRTIRVRSDKDSDKKILFNTLVNNFPAHWNRNEEYNEILDYKFSISANKNALNTAEPLQEGWELNTPLLIKNTWLNSAEPEKSYLSTSNKNIIILSLQALNENNTILLRLLNTNPDSEENVKIISELFEGFQASEINFAGKLEKELLITNNALNISFSPNQVKTIKLFKK